MNTRLLAPATLLGTLLGPLLAAMPQAAAQRTATGRVTDVLGDPIPAASVRAELDGATVARGATDGEGIYHLRVPAGSDLVFAAAGKADHRLAWRGPATPTVRHVVLRDAGRLRGRVLDAGGAPVRDATVIAVHGNSSQSARTNESGDFVFAAIPLERLQLRATRGALFVDRSLRLVDADNHCQLTLPRRAIATRVVRVDGLPAAAIGRTIVRVTTPDLALLPNRGLERLGPDGSVELPLGDWALIQPAADGFRLSPRGRIAFGGGATLRFRATPLAADDRVTLRGRVRTTRGQTVAGLRLAVRDRSHRDLAEIGVDAVGNFQLEIERPTEDMCRFGMTLGAWELTGDDRSLRDGCAWVSAWDLSHPIELWIQQTGGVHCPVRTADGTRLGLADVVVADPEFEYRPLMTTTTDQAGRMQTWLPSGNYELLAVSPTGNVCTGSASVRHGQVLANVGWRTVPSGSVTGTLVDETGRPLPGVELFFADVAIQNENNVRASRRQRARVHTDRRGRFRCRGLPAGTWTAVALDEDGVGSTQFVIEKGKEARIELKRAAK